MRSQPILLALAALFASSVIAQDRTTTAADKDATATAVEAAETTADDADTSLPDIDQTSTEKTTTAAPTTTAASSGTETLPGITTSTSTNDDSDLPDVPGAYSYPAPTVPPTNNAPYRQQETLPQGTIFIAVGAILGAFGAGVLIWRAVVACLLHRSVKRAALVQHIANDKASYPAPSSNFYKYSDHASSASFGNLTAGRGVRRTQRGPIPSATPSQSNLFFSPTAPSLASTAGNRESRFLPSGFYAAGAPQQDISMTNLNLRPDSRGPSRSFEPSPPESPNLAPRNDISRRNPSSSTLNLHRPSSGRAPSAYLEDLLGDQPEQFPPPGNRNTWHQSQGRM
ncbi:Uu.00g089560.m01.CDS01 [Anthostomella pinea]|uniref:Uu.00g089560.m01.CDS01 n=1 Tax=Anthostomella pinea TaxID=933095 RepID=A0AAI8YK66_9PEZI|nr:Uu.00g089560.m01.CDS01 [Anthostomella pinea]